jgi:hypothetical protein
MKIEWNQVTWYSWVVAILVFGAVYFMGMYVGMQIEKKTLLDNALNPGPSAVHVTPTTPATQTPQK